MSLNHLRAALLAASLLLSGCGGGDNDAPPVEPAALPATITIEAASTAEVDAAVVFTTDLTGATTGLKFVWTFGDGASSTDASPSHTYATGGEYNVTLTVSDTTGATRTSQFAVLASRSAMVAGAACSGEAQSGWCWQRPKPVGGAMVDLFFIDATTGWAVGEAGHILKTIDGGANWTSQRSNVSTWLRQVRFVDATTGWAVGDGTTIVKTTNGGTTWVAQASGISSPDYYYASSLTVVDASRAVLSVGCCGTRTTTDGGEHWDASMFSPTLTTTGGAMWSYSGNTVSLSSDMGQTSRVMLQLGESAQVQSIAFSGESNGWISGYEYQSYDYLQFMWRTTDGGSNWQSIGTAGLPDATSVSGMRFTSSKVGWLLSSGRPYRSSDAGGHWKAVALPSALQYHEWWYYTGTQPVFFDDTTAWLPYENGGYLTRDSGASWIKLNVEGEPYDYDDSPRLQLTAGGAMWLHYAKRSYRSVDNGSTWQRTFGQDADDFGASLLAAWFFDAKKGLAYSSSGWIVETADAGVTWTRRTLRTASDYGRSRLQFASASNGWLLSTGYPSSISVTTDGGLSWFVPLSPVDFGGVQDFHFVDAQLGWAVGSNGAINRSTDGGKTWALQTTLPYGLSGVRFTSATTGIAVGPSGSIARTTDAGATWTLRASGVTYSLTKVYFVDATIGWAVGSYGTVVKTTDGGLTWSRVAVPSNLSLNDVAFIDAHHGWIVGSSGTVLATADGGQTWRLQPSGTDQDLYGAVFTDTRSGWLFGAGGTILATATGGN